MSNQQPTGFPWSSLAGNTPTSGNPSITPAGGYINPASGAAYSPPGTRTSTFGAPSITPAGGHPITASGASYNPFGAMTTATQAPAPAGGFMTSTHIAQPGPPYTPTSAGVSTTAASFANAPVAQVQAPPGSLPTPNQCTATHGTNYGPSPWASATPRSTNAPYPIGNPHVAPGYTYQHQPLQLSPTPTGGHIPRIAQAVPQQQ